MKYYIEYSGKAIGPMTAEQVVAYGVTPNTKVCAEGGEWLPLYTFPELMAKVNNLCHTAKAGAEDSQRIVCGVLALLIGGLGLHYFLIGKAAGGFINIGLCLITCGFWSILNFIQGILILCMSEEDWHRKFVDSTSIYPLF